MPSSKCSRRGIVVIGLALPVVLVASVSVAAEDLCRPVRGHYEEHDASGPGCDSPVGLCIAGDYRGSINATFEGQATAILPTADTSTSGVVLFTSDSTISGRVGGRSGTLLIKNAGAFRTTGEGSIVDVQTIIGGTGDLSGASGEIRAEGVFTAGEGTSRYAGIVCLP